MEVEPLIATVLVGMLLGGALAVAILKFGRRRSTSASSDTSALSFVAEHLPVGVLLFSTEGRIAHANEAARTWLFDGADPEGRNFLQLLGDAPEGLFRALTDSQDSIFSLSSDGQQQTFQVLRREVSFGKAPHVLLLINPLTREITRREVETLKKVIAVINHELNNSLASLSSLVSSARFIVAHPDQLHNLGRVLDGIEGRTQHLGRFLGEYAQLSRLPRPRPCEVTWEPLLDRLQQLYPEAQIGEPPTPTGWFDEAQLEQALLNLLKNASEAEGSARQVKLVFRTAQEMLEVGVLDRGTGFSAEALQQGLLPFYSTKDGGSGVGLALCREVADGHGGGLRIKTREGGGSAVYLLLPLGAETPPPGQALALSLTRT